MFVMNISWILFWMLVIFLDVVSTSSCSDSYDSTCVSDVRSLLLDQSVFWFGTSYASECPQRQDGRLQCQNRHSDRTDSLLSRITGRYSVDPTYLTFVVNVTYKLPFERSYDGCSVKVKAPKVTSDIFTIDPLSDTLYHPFDVRTQPEVTWPSEAVSKYTVLFYDANFFDINALFINVHGGSLRYAETIVHYIGPSNPLPRNSPYVWVVFEQQGVLHRSDVISYIASAKENNSGIVYLEDMITGLHLLGPLGINILQMTTDEYASVLSRRSGIINKCPIFYGHWLEEHIQSRGELSFLQTPLALSLSVDLTFKTPDVTYIACCIRNHHRATTMHLDYRDFGLHDSLAYNATPTVSLVTVQNPNISSQTLTNKIYTFLLLDCSISLHNIQARPFIHWAVVNVHGSDIKTGETVKNYTAPASSEEVSLVLMLVLEQTSAINSSALLDFVEDPCQLEYSRCEFEIEDFLASYSMSVVGLRLLPYKSSPYQKLLLYDMYNASTMSEQCSGQPGYTDPCPALSAVHPSASYLNVLLVILLIVY